MMLTLFISTRNEQYITGSFTSGQSQELVFVQVCIYCEEGTMMVLEHTYDSLLLVSILKLQNQRCYLVILNNFSLDHRLLANLFIIIITAIFVGFTVVCIG